MKLKSIIFLLFCPILLACDSHLAYSPDPAFFQLALVTDKSGLDTIAGDELTVNIASIRIWRGSELRDWAIVADTNRVYNLFGIEESDGIPIANKETLYLPPGTYSRLTVRLLIQDTLMVLGGVEYPVEMVFETAQITNVDELMTLNSGEISHMKLIFEASESLTSSLGRYILEPKFTLTAD